MASLIVLSTVAAAIPMGNMNLFSDAMASGKHSDRNYNYQEDEKNYYSDDDTKYSPDYNYYQYYQPMQQQEQQSLLTITTTVMIMTIKIKKYLMTLVMRI